MERNGEAAGLQPELAPESQKRSCATTYDPTLCLTSAKLYASLLGYGVGDGTLFDCAQFEPAKRRQHKARFRRNFFDRTTLPILLKTKSRGGRNRETKLTFARAQRRIHSIDRTLSLFTGRFAGLGRITISEFEDGLPTEPWPAHLLRFSSTVLGRCKQQAGGSTDSGASAWWLRGPATRRDFPERS
jgi:hypothetical protein